MSEKDTIVFDIETKKEFAEVGGRGHPELLGVAVLGAYSYNQDKYFTFEEHELKAFEEMLRNTELLIGFCSKGFDVPVLQPYISFNLKKIPMLDLMDEVHANVGFRVGLDNLARNTIGAAKSADGLTALEWFRAGRVQDVKDYCLKDVEITKKLYEFGKEFGHVKFFSRQQMGEATVSVNWKTTQSEEKDDRQTRLI